MSIASPTVSRRDGFTIVELLIVIVVIGILAAITIVAYNGIQERARVATAQSDLTNISKKIELYQAEKGTYPPNLAELRTIGIKPSTTGTGAGSIALACGNANGYVIFINEVPDYKGRQFKIGSGLPLTEISPKLPWASATLCGSTPFPTLSWASSW